MCPSISLSLPPWLRFDLILSKLNKSHSYFCLGLVCRSMSLGAGRFAKMTRTYMAYKLVIYLNRIFKTVRSKSAIYPWNSMISLNFVCVVSPRPNSRKVCKSFCKEARSPQFFSIDIVYWLVVTMRLLSAQLVTDSGGHHPTCIYYLVQSIKLEQMPDKCYHHNFFLVYNSFLSLCD